MEQSIFSDNLLLNAWYKVKNKNTAGGIDGVSIEEFEKNLDENLLQLKQSLLSQTYVPEPYERIYIKKENFTFYFPIVTCILASIILTIVFSFIRR